jgi:mRNA interferase MazF
LPRRGEILLVNFDLTVGTEIKKTRPAVVVSSDAVGRLPIKLVAPLTDWKNHYAQTYGTFGLTRMPSTASLNLQP